VNSPKNNRFEPMFNIRTNIITCKWQIKTEPFL
jgi:hypothetical protein